CTTAASTTMKKNNICVSFPLRHLECSKDIPLKGGSKKLHPRFIGPFTISRIINPVAVKLDLPRTLRVHPVFHVSKLKPERVSLLHAASEGPPPPRLVDGGPVYTIKSLLDSRRVGRGVQYLVDWEGYGPADRQWVPSRHAGDEDLISRFHRDPPDRPCRPLQAPPLLLVLSMCGTQLSAVRLICLYTI
uniref:Chromo domain-containing protein n=1 Tax=Oryzias latipes TaxID=8090 RepID=A0A3P9K051_ORYLA